MATAPWWWVPLITVIGTPLLGALLYFLVPLARVGKGLGIWLSNPPWWVQNIFAALLVGGIVAVASIWWQNSLSEASARHATRLENLRFVRQLSSEPGIVARPFRGFDLQEQNLVGLDLTGADLGEANLQHANLSVADLRLAPPTHPGTRPRASDLSFANLTGAHLYDADLTGAHLDGAHLDGAKLKYVHCDENTKWPHGFKPPPCG
jgi:hypothetical protein